ncbi:MAG: tRNA (guanosine(37)-N1)-methyltransferase TrmD [Deltaproteobacteria bacterium]|nr:tRNA (guanosine(37)-N1)-methyltransferase TrmD [Deltaproteobacteria bacterium]
MNFDVVTIFPHMFERVFEKGVVGKALECEFVSLKIHNLRDFTTDKHKTVDDIPYGGGGGLIFKMEPLVRALRAIQDPKKKSRSILLSPRGKKLDAALVQNLSQFEQLIIFCGRYEGVDERFSAYVDDEISIGDYVLSGGELAAMVMVDAVSRFIPGVVGKIGAPFEDSFTRGDLEYPYYTRPECFEGNGVPEVLLSGHHEEIKKWREKEALKCTLQRRADLLKKPNT